MTPNISLAAEVVFHIGPFAITNSIFTAWLVSLGLLLFGAFIRFNLKKMGGKLQTGLELIYDWLIETANGIIGNRAATAEVLPYLLTIFLFILFSNWSGLLPGFNSVGFHEMKEGHEILVPLLRAPTSDLNMVAVLALFSMGYVQYLGFKYAGFKGYAGRFVNISNPIGFFVGVLELLGEFTRIISFTFRLFGNVFAGEVLIMVMFYLTMTLLPYIAIIPLPFFLLEMFVGLIQAFIFTFLTIIFVSLAVISHDTEGHAHGGEELHLTT
ncbi:MAG: F0F1 ATP synthase subunit A [bacterium]